MSELLTFLGAFLGVSGIGVAALLFFMGSSGAAGVLAEVLKLINLGLGFVLPVLSQILAGFLSGLRWVWENVLLKGLQDICDSIPTIATVVLMGAMLWGAIKFQYDERIENRQAAINACYAELGKLKKRPAASRPQPPTEKPFPMPWDLLFKL